MVISCGTWQLHGKSTHFRAVHCLRSSFWKLLEIVAATALSSLHQACPASRSFGVADGVGGWADSGRAYSDEWSTTPGIRFN